MRNHRIGVSGAMIALIAVLAHPADSAALTIQDGTGGWLVRSEPHVDLWYHAMAVSGTEGIGSLSLSDPSYAATIQAAKTELGIYPTPLDRMAGRLRSAVLRDPSFEIFHFLPVYFAGAGRMEMMDALRAVAVTPSGMPQVRYPGARFGAAAVASVLTSREQRALLGELVQAISQEWDLFYREYRQAQGGSGVGTVATVQRMWAAEFGPALRPYLASTGLDRGALLISPAVGPEGRVFAGDPGNREDNVVVVGSSASGGAVEDLLYAAVREMCFPTVRRSLERVDLRFESRSEGDETSSWAAVRCGEALVERYLPERLSSYRESALRLRGSSRERGELGETMRAAFPIHPRLESALIEEINRT